MMMSWIEYRLVSLLGALVVAGGVFFMDSSSPAQAQTPCPGPAGTICLFKDDRPDPVRVGQTIRFNREGGKRLQGAELPGRPPRLELVWADAAYAGRFGEWARKERGWRMEVAYRPDRQRRRYGLEDGPRGFKVIPRRWVVERAFAWLGQARRFSKDYERLPEVAEAMTYWAMSRIMLRRRVRTA